MHLTEEDLILHYYGEADDASRDDRHLASCDTCRADFARLRQVLTWVDTQPVPEPPDGFERIVWARLEPQLRQRRAWLRQIFQGMRPWVFAGGVAALVLVSFLAGRFSNITPSPVAPATGQQADVGERVLLFAMVDHLDRSQIVLVELLNAEDGDAATTGGEQLRAKELVAANRLYRQSAVRTGDRAMGEVLDELERVLLEIANAPADATTENLDALRARIQSGGLLFRVRVVQSEMRERERRTLNVGSTS